MARDEAAPYGRGESHYGPDGTIDANDLGGGNVLGQEFFFRDNDPSSVGQASGTQRGVTTRVVRNVSGITLKPGRLVRYKAGDPYETEVDGYTFAVGDRPAGIVDEYLPAAGVRNNDVFNIVIDGPTKGKALSASASVLVIGDRLVPGTGTSATNDDAGRIAKQDLSGATTVLGANLQNAVGYAGEDSNSVEDALVKIVIHRAGK